MKAVKALISLRLLSVRHVCLSIRTRLHLHVYIEAVGVNKDIGLRALHTSRV